MALFAAQLGGRHAYSCRAPTSRRRPMFLTEMAQKFQNKNQCEARRRNVSRVRASSPRASSWHWVVLHARAGTCILGTALDQTFRLTRDSDWILVLSIYMVLVGGRCARVRRANSVNFRPTARESIATHAHAHRVARGRTPDNLTRFSAFRAPLLKTS